MTIRPSSADIDRQILDITAGLIAHRGVKDTSVQEVADRAGYSKAGILKRFSTKAALVAASIDQYVDVARTMNDRLATIDDPLQRDSAALVAFADLALSHPGWIELSISGLSGFAGDELAERATRASPFIESAFRLAKADAEGDLTRRARVVSAIGVIAVLALTYESLASRDQAHALMLTIGWDTLGHRVARPSA